MKIVYMGTPDFAVAPLLALMKAGHQILAVVTQPDKQKGRGKELQMPPVKECAVSCGIPVLQPVKIRERESVEQLRQYPADVFVIAAFGQLLTQEILDMPKYGCINIHASLLPDYRGAAPIQWAVINGEKKAGVTIMQMEKGLDTGDMLLKREVEMDEKETGGSLHDKLMDLGAELIVEVLPLLEQGKIIPQKQGECSFYAKRLSKAMGLIDWNKEAVSIERLIRGLNPWPSAYAFYKGRTLKIWEADVETADIPKEKQSPPGTVVCVEKDSFVVQTGKDVLRIRSLQLEGKKKVTARDFMLGYEVSCGMRLGQ